jgi:hypothetical protein
MKKILTSINEQVQESLIVSAILVIIITIAVFFV